MLLLNLYLCHRWNYRGGSIARGARWIPEEQSHEFTGKRCRWNTQHRRRWVVSCVLSRQVPFTTLFCFLPKETAEISLWGNDLFWLTNISCALKWRRLFFLLIPYSPTQTVLTPVGRQKLWNRGHISQISDWNRTLHLYLFYPETYAIFRRTDAATGWFPSYQHRRRNGVELFWWIGDSSRSHRWVQ